MARDCPIHTVTEEKRNRAALHAGDSPTRNTALLEDRTTNAVPQDPPWIVTVPMRGHPVSTMTAPGIVRLWSEAIRRSPKVLTIAHRAR